MSQEFPDLNFLRLAQNDNQIKWSLSSEDIAEGSTLADPKSYETAKSLLSTQKASSEAAGTSASTSLNSRHRT